MIYRCENKECDYWGEGAALPERCPWCGGVLCSVQESEMKGDDWSSLGS